MISTVVPLEISVAVTGNEDTSIAKMSLPLATVIELATVTYSRRTHFLTLEYTQFYIDMPPILLPISAFVLQLVSEYLCHAQKWCTMVYGL